MISASGNSRDSSRGGRSWRIGASPAVTSCESRPGISMPSLALARRLLAADRREGVGVLLQLRVGELLAERVDLAQLGRQVGVQLAAGRRARRAAPGAGSPTVEYCIDDQVLDLVVEALADHPAAAGYGECSSAATNRLRWWK